MNADLMRISMPTVCCIPKPWLLSIKQNNKYDGKDSPTSSHNLQRSPAEWQVYTPSTFSFSVIPASWWQHLPPLHYCLASLPSKEGSYQFIFPRKRTAQLSDSNLGEFYRCTGMINWSDTGFLRCTWTVNLNSTQWSANTAESVWQQINRQPAT